MHLATLIEKRDPYIYQFYHKYQ